MPSTNGIAVLGVDVRHRKTQKTDALRTRDSVIRWK